MTSDERWLAAAWPFVRAQLPPSPARVLEIGCGPLGGFVPMLRQDGHEAVDVDPEAPEGAGYHQVGFEQFNPPGEVDVVVASLSLHHVSGLDEVLDRVRDTLTPDGTFVVVEWAWERFDDATARWCFERLPPPGPEPGWLHRRRDEWIAADVPWDDYVRGWATADGMHTGETVLRELGARFRTTMLERGPYFFPDLDGVSEEDEHAAIERSLIRATRIRFVGRRK